MVGYQEEAENEEKADSYLCLKVHVKDSVCFIHNKKSQRTKTKPFGVLKVIN